jgi:Tol biopolymer transport system component
MRMSSSEIMSGAWDAALNRPVGDVKPAAGNLRSNDSPQWSPDSTVLVYKSGATTAGQGPRLVFVSYPTGQKREVQISDMQLIGNGGAFSPDGKSLVVVGIDQKRRRGAHLIDVETGKAIGLTYDGPAETMFFPQFVASGTGVAFLRRINDGSRPNEVVLFDLATREERKVPLGAGLERACCSLLVSPDGQRLIFRSGRVVPGGPIVMSGPVTGPFKEIARGDQIDEVLSWMPDGKHILVRTSTTAPGGRETARLWRMPADGGQRTEVVGLDTHAMQVAFSPDGRQVAYQTRTGNIDIWKVDGLVPLQR